MILGPGFFRGLYEITRPPIVYETETLSLQLRRGWHVPRCLKFGLDVWPNMMLCIARPGIIIFTLPFYVIFMALWFPFLPLIQ